MTITPVRATSGDIIHFIAVKEDVTRRKQEQSALKLFRSLLDQTTDVIEVIDPETGRFLDVNERACLAHGYTREEYLALTLSEIAPPLAARPSVEVKEARRR